MTRDLMERVGKEDEETSRVDEEHYRDVTGIAYVGKTVSRCNFIGFCSPMPFHFSRCRHRTSSYMPG